MAGTLSRNLIFRFIVGLHLRSCVHRPGCERRAKRSRARTPCGPACVRRRSRWSISSGDECPASFSSSSWRRTGRLAPTRVEESPWSLRRSSSAGPAAMPFWHVPAASPCPEACRAAGATMKSATHRARHRRPRQPAVSRPRRRGDSRRIRPLPTQLSATPPGHGTDFRRPVSCVRRGARYAA